MHSVVPENPTAPHGGKGKATVAWAVFYIACGRRNKNKTTPSSVSQMGGEWGHKTSFPAQMVGPARQQALRLIPFHSICQFSLCSSGEKLQQCSDAREKNGHCKLARKLHLTYKMGEKFGKQPPTHTYIDCM